MNQSSKTTDIGAMGWLHVRRRNHFTAGAAYDRNRVDFAQSTQFGYLNPDRSVTGVNSFADGVTGGDEDGVPFDSRVDLRGRISTGSLYATDTLSARQSTSEHSLFGRYNRTTIRQPRPDPACGRLGLSRRRSCVRPIQPRGRFYLQANGIAQSLSGYSEGSRAPTSIELGCADPDQPCKLPNAMAGDPPLQQVVTRTLEAGVRGSQGTESKMERGWFRADNRDDILFVTSNSPASATSRTSARHFGRGSKWT